MAFLETKRWYLSDAEYKIVLKVIDLLYLRSGPEPSEAVSIKQGVSRRDYPLPKVINQGNLAEGTSIL